MIRRILIILTFSLAIYSISIGQPAGENCSNSKAVNLVCPTIISFSGETTSGYANDVSAFGFSTPGNDRVYQITIPAGSLNILVSVTSVSSPFYLFFRNNNCSAGSGTSRYISSPSHNINFPVSGAGPYYLWVDNNSLTDVTYSISFGVTTSYNSSTKGNWDWDMSSSCTFPMTKPNLKVTWNGVHQNIPIVYSPTGVPGVVCGTLFFQNPTGVEGVKTLTFDFGPHLSSVSPTVTSMPGNYNAGTWNASVFGNFISWTFTDDAGLGYGDNPGTSGSCFQYQFCFNMTPLSNDPLGTIIQVWAYPDGRGAASYNGCCATTSNCSIPGSDGASGPIGVAFDDPLLPVNIKYFKCEKFDEYNHLIWEAEMNSHFEKFEIERSYDKELFKLIEVVSTPSNNSGTQKFSYKDFNGNGACYYRLKQTDTDGSYNYSKTIYASDKNPEVKIYPQPASAVLNIETSKEIKEITISGAVNNVSRFLKSENNKVNISDLAPGVYFIQINFEDTVVIEKFIKE